MPVMRRLIICIYIWLSYCLFSIARVDEGHKMKEYIQRVQELDPRVNVTICTDKFQNRSLNPICLHNDGRQDICPESYPGPRLAWLLRCLASELVNNGYQIPAYVIDPPRYDDYVPIQKYVDQGRRIAKFLQAANFKFVRTVDPNLVRNKTAEIKEFVAPVPPYPNATKEERERCIANLVRNKTAEIKEFVAPVPPYPNATKEERERCIAVLASSLDGNIAKATAECHKDGAPSLLGGPDEPNLPGSSIQHAFLQKLILERTFSDCNATQSCLSNGTSPDLRFAVIFEDDQFIPSDGHLRLVELILQSYPSRVGLYFLCDSYSEKNSLYDPKGVGATIYTSSFPTSKSRTVAAYMFTEDTLYKWFHGGKYIPLTRPIDHQLNYMIQEEKTLTHNSMPPSSCHGSMYYDAPLKNDANFFENKRSHCQHCCERFYHIPSMKPKSPTILLQ